MGCCPSTLSLSRDTDHPSYTTRILPECRTEHVSPPGIHTTTSAIVASHPSASLTTTPGVAVSHSTSRRRQPATQFPLNEHYNAPIRPHVWYSKRRAWTRAQLDQERREFFETRVTGRPEVWAALSAAISLMWACDFDTAQSIIDAAGVTVPTGDLCQGAYDEQGALYRLPQCIVSDPENIVRGDSAENLSGDDDDSDGNLAPDEAEASGDELISEQREKGKISERDLIRVKARLSDRGGADIIISVGKTQIVGYIARKVEQEAGITGNRRVKIVYLGKPLREQKPLVDQGYKEGHVLNALVIARNSTS